ncbi:hypothetical protein L915_19244 [Phytophthora nicotianae]|uniref:Uncharacterized protein n=1 Tax=Phytophthora nicotianae TaxID=4792 RepID=W2FV94_PHYNI|nr:hypothetical protein L915_19244 [Phytophthora nicotianae]ETL27293.1 hypothetical protein L916_19138 [Phytophthora nicotianae]
MAQPSGIALMSPTLTPPSRSLTDHVAVEVDEWQKLKKSECTEHSKGASAPANDGQKRVYLCTRARRSVKGAPVTCLDLWHHDWQRGRSLAEGLMLSMIRARAPATKSQKRRRLDSELEGTISSDDEQNK